MAEPQGTGHHQPAESSDPHNRWEEWFIARAIEGVVTIGHDGRILSLNHAAEQIFRCSASQVLGTPFDQFIPERLREGHQKHLAGFSRSEAHSLNMTGREPLAALRADGEEFLAEISVVRLNSTGPTGQSGWACLLRDVTEKRLIEEAVLQGRKLESLGVLAAGIAHDFNNILAVLLGNAEVALKQLPPNSPAREAIVDMRDASQRAAELVRQLVQFSGNSDMIEMQAVDMNALVRETARLSASTLGPDCTLQLRLDPDLPLLRCDPTGIRRVIMNLVLNASEAVGERSGRVVVGTSVVEPDRRMLHSSRLGADLEPGKYVCLTVSDNGPGIDPAVRAKMFDPFFTTRFPGRGLGLANVFGIVRAHRGGIRVTSRAGRGAAFRVLLPLAAAPIPEAGADAPC